MSKPRNIAEAMTALDAMFTKNGLDARSFADAAEFAVKLHMSAGHQIRNSWGLWERPEGLARELRAMGITHADDMSGELLRAYWHWKHGRFLEWHPVRSNNASPTDGTYHKELEDNGETNFMRVDGIDCLSLGYNKKKNQYYRRRDLQWPPHLEPATPEDIAYIEWVRNGMAGPQPEHTLIPLGTTPGIRKRVRDFRAAHTGQDDASSPPAATR